MKKNDTAMLTIHTGAGGLEARDWAHMLFRMYHCWALRQGHEFEELNWGFDYKVAAVRGPGVLGLLKGERGVHRLVRVSPFDPQRRRHTSFAMALVESAGDFGKAKTYAQRGWENQIRSYVLHPYMLARNHDAGRWRTEKVMDVLDGDLSAFIKEKTKR